VQTELGIKSSPTRAVGYVRISVDRVEETSTATQEDRIRAYCAAQGWSVVDVIVEPGRSAYKSSRSTRPGLRQAMQIVASGAADVLIVWKIDRACRDVTDTLGLVEQLAEHGAQFVSVTEGFDTSAPAGRMILVVLAALAELESATKSERTLAWHAQRRSEGRVPSGPRPYGYRRERNALLILDAEAAVIRRAANQVLAGVSLRSITAGLATAGVMGRGGRPMTARTLRQVLLSPTVTAARASTAGTFTPSTSWEAILSRDVWDAVRARLLDPSRRTTPGPARRYLLTGVATCGRCDERTPMQCKSGIRYLCPRCGLSIDRKHADRVVERDLLIALDPGTWKRLREGRAPATDLAEFETGMNFLTARFVAGDLDATQLAENAEALRRQQEAVSAPPPPLPDVTDPAQGWGDFTIEQKRLVLVAATESLTIAPWTPAPRFDEGRISWVPVF
jgi:DNA invertase Pin-like site-specific DNA recombinase